MLLMKSIAQEVAALIIRVNSICPGAIRTPMNRLAWEDRDAYEGLMTLIPYKRIGEPEEIGRLAAFLASDYTDYITGASIFVDGGMSLYPGLKWAVSRIALIDNLLRQRRKRIAGFRA